MITMATASLISPALINMNIGHGNQRITEAVVKQMQEVAYVTPSCVTKVRADLRKETGGNLPRRSE